MPSMRHHDPGNMIVRFSIDYPKTIPDLSHVQKFGLKTILGMRAKTETVAEKEMREEWELEYVRRLEKLRQQEMKERRAGKHVMLVSELPPPVRMSKSLDDMDVDAGLKVEEAESPAPAVLEGLGKERDPDPLYNPSPDAHIDPVELFEPDAKDDPRTNGMMMEDEDEDGMPQGGERVQCGTQ